MNYKDVLRAEKPLGKDKACTTNIRYRCPIAIVFVAASAAILAGCGGSSAAPPLPSFSIGGTVSGLKAGTSLVLADNGIDSLTVSGNATFTFAKSIQSGNAYAVTIATPASGQTCTVSNGSGVVASSNVSNVGVSCAPTTYSIGGKVSGLTTGSTVVISDNGADEVALSANGTFQFPTPVETGATFQVTVATQPTSQQCIVSQGAGTVGNSNVSNVLVQCPSITMLHAFTGGMDGEGPVGRLVLASDGNFYGTTAGNGHTDFGTVYRITPAGDETVLWNFKSGADGEEPLAGLIQASDGFLYGTTFAGGLYNAGTVFKISLDGQETVVWSFGQGTDGTFPHAALIEGQDGYFYGTTQGGGANVHGTVFKISPAGSETVVWNFGSAANDGTQPLSPLLQDTDGTIYGTTFTGGTNDLGTVFKVTSSGLSILWNFGAPNDGGNPVGGLTRGADGAFYGASQGGDIKGLYGTGFRVTAAGDETVLWYFSDHFDVGTWPDATLVLSQDGNFYGTTTGGPGGIYRTTADGTLTGLWTFSLPNEGPIEGVIEGPDGAFYGTTVGYQNGTGTTPAGHVYKLTF